VDAGSRACHCALCRNWDPGGALLEARPTLRYPARLGPCARRRRASLAWLARLSDKKPGLAAGIAVFAIALVLTGLVIFVGQALVSSIASGTQTFQSFFKAANGANSLVRISPHRARAARHLGGQLQSMAGRGRETRLGNRRRLCVGVGSGRLDLFRPLLSFPGSA
jgi:hypothetical protein